MRQIEFTFLATLMLALSTASPSALAQATAAQQVPDAIKAPAGQEVVLVAHATGVQIYACTAVDGRFTWTLKAPDAELHDSTGTLIGYHSAGPTWKLNDGSAITGKAAAKAESPEQDSIPWLLINVVSHSGSGQLSRVLTVQRVNTQGGAPPPSGCDASRQGSETKQTYKADYYFFAPGR
jgi:hypothetical protein